MKLGWRRFLLLLLLLMGCGIAGMLAFHPEVKAVLLAGMGYIGLPAFLLFTLVYNTLVIPFPYDPFMVGMLAVEGMELRKVLKVAIVGSTFAGLCAYLMGTYFSRYTARWFKGKRSQIVLEKLEKRGLWVLASSAIVPIPLSLMCWMCGLTKQPVFHVFWILLVTRGARLTLVALLFSQL